MQIIEVLLYVYGFIMVGLLMMKPQLKKNSIFILFGFFWLTLALHVFIGHIRWQLYPLYFAVFLLLIMVMFQHFKKTPKTHFVLKGLLGIALVSLIASIISVIIFPVYAVPTPSGPYLIGTESFVIEDQSRIEIYGNETGDIRKFKIQLWYPAETIDGYERAPWLEDGIDIARGLSQDNGLPFFVLDHTATILSNAYLSAPISNAIDDYPVVIISHGWRGFRNLHTDMAEELASIGYIVVAVDHTYGSVATVINDTVIYLDKSALPWRDTTPDFLEYANRLVNTYASDIITTLDFLEVMNQDAYSRFSQSMDLTTIGLLGHSTGGGASVTVALSDARIDAIIGFDAWVEPIKETEIINGLNIPVLFLRSETWETGPNNITLKSLIESSSYTPQLYQIDGTTHTDFTMIYMYSPLTKVIGFSGDLDGEYLNIMLKHMVTDFFDKTLRNFSNSELDHEQWQEVKPVQ